METKINLYEVPVTEVFEIVREETTKAIDSCLKAFQDVDHIHVELSVKVIASHSQYILPIKAMLNYIEQQSSVDEFEEQVMSFARDEYHQSLSV